MESSDSRFTRTVEAIERELLRGNHVMRYASEDDFGMPESAFLICRFWLIDAWWWLGRREEARDLFIDALGYRNRYGLLSEDIHPQTGQLWGNFPQTFVGGIDTYGNAFISQLGGSILARLILVSNQGFHRSRRSMVVSENGPRFYRAEVGAGLATYAADAV